MGKAALAALMDLENAVQKTREGSNANSVTIATTPSFAMRWLLPRLPKLAEMHSKIEVSIIVDQVRNSPTASGADLNIRMGSQPTDTPNPIPLMDEQVFPVMTPQLWDQLSRPSRVADLQGLPLLHDRDPGTSWATWRKEIGPKRLDVRHGPRLTADGWRVRAWTTARLSDRLGRRQLISAQTTGSSPILRLVVGVSCVQSSRG